jgi:hypothetical protein
MTLAERAQAVQTREDLTAFVAELNADFDDNRGAWTNADLASFLEATAAWVQDMDSYYQNTGQRLADLPPWRIVADILMAARNYE